MKQTTPSPRAEARTAGWKTWFGRLLLFCGLSLYLELCLQFLLYAQPVKHTIYSALFGIMSGVLCTLLVSLLPRIPQRIAAVLLVLLQTVLAEVQLIYHAVFGSMMPLRQIRMGGGVLKSFGSQILYAIRVNLLPVLLLLLPLALLLLLITWKKRLRLRQSWQQALAGLGLLALLGSGTFLLMRFGCRHTIPVLQYFRDDTTQTDLSYRNLGMNATTLQELRALLLSDPKQQSVLTQTDLSNVPVLYDPAQYQVLPGLNLKQLAEETEDPQLAELDRFFAGREPSKKNADTGRLKNFNVIEICAESYCPWFLSEDLTPTLCKMSAEGLIFDNYYGSYQAMTSNGEFLLCLGLYADDSRGSTDNSFDAVVGHALPFCMGTSLRNAGYETFAYHNYIGEFYNRAQSHPSMGYQFKSASNGLDITVQWPASDLEMMEASVDDYINLDQPFHAYYMTFSAHYQYDWNNAMAAKHRAEVEQLPYNDTIKAYIACNLELEYAMRYLLQRLEEADKLNSTVIVLTNDHYPYGLAADNYGILLGREVNLTFDRFQNQFMCYAPGLGETRHVTDYCSTADILPTMLNLLGISYDARMLAGTDILSDSLHMAVLADGSFLTEDFRYDAGTGEVTPYDPETQVEEARVQALKTEVANRFAFSRQILYTDYYAHVVDGANSAGGEGTGLPFHDCPGPGIQANMLFLYNKGLLDLTGPDEIGYDKPAVVGDFVTAFHRYFGAPSADSRSLPADYLAGRSSAQRESFRESACYPAVCWAFETGILRPGDRILEYDQRIDNISSCLMMYRCAALLGRDMTVEDSAISALGLSDSRLTEEEQRAAAWCVESQCFRADSLDGAFDPEKQWIVYRNRMTLFLIWTLYPEVEVK